MLDYRATLKLIGGAVLFATVVYGLLVAPGFLSATDRLPPARQSNLETVR